MDLYALLLYPKLLLVNTKPLCGYGSNVRLELARIHYLADTRTMVSITG